MNTAERRVATLGSGDPHTPSMGEPVLIVDRPWTEGPPGTGARRFWRGQRAHRVRPDGEATLPRVSRMCPAGCRWWRLGRVQGTVMVDGHRPQTDRCGRRGEADFPPPCPPPPDSCFWRPLRPEQGGAVQHRGGVNPGRKASTPGLPPWRGAGTGPPRLAWSMRSHRRACRPPHCAGGGGELGPGPPLMPRADRR